MLEVEFGGLLKIFRIEPFGTNLLNELRKRCRGFDMGGGRAGAFKRIIANDARTWFCPGGFDPVCPGQPDWAP